MSRETNRERIISRKPPNRSSAQQGLTLETGGTAWKKKSAK